MERDEEYLAQLIFRDVRELEELAKLEGVRAYLKKPKPRTKVTPNRNFLQKTLHNVAYQNQKAEEDLLWKARKKQLRIPRTSKRKTSPEEHHGSAAMSKRRKEDWKVRKEMDEEEIGRFLMSKRKRGKGGIGSRHDFIGPIPLDEDSSLSRSTAHGPHKPSHLCKTRSPNPVNKEKKTSR